jgi:biopolymer transport protein ExbD
MKIRRPYSGSPDKINIDMAPMIDIVFQLLIFFMLTLKILEPEGNFDINMPLTGQPQEGPPPLEIRVRLAANEDGSLAQVFFGKTPLGADVPQCFQRLNDQIASLAGNKEGFSDELTVKIAADYNLHYQYSIKAVSACTGRLGPNKKTIRFVDKIQFEPPRRPGI